MPLLCNASIFGVGVLASAATLQGLYKVTNFYPPAPVFWFFSGVGGYLAVEVAEVILKRDLIKSKALTSS